MEVRKAGQCVSPLTYPSFAVAMRVAFRINVGAATGDRRSQPSSAFFFVNGLAI